MSNWWYGLSDGAQATIIVGSITVLVAIAIPSVRGVWQWKRNRSTEPGLIAVNDVAEPEAFNGTLQQAAEMPVQDTGPAEEANVIAAEAMRAGAEAQYEAVNLQQRTRIASGHPFVVSYAGKVNSMDKLDIDYKPVFHLDALDVEISFGDFDRIKVGNHTYELERWPADDRRGVLLALDMAVPNVLPVIFTYWLEGDHTEQRHTTETSVQLFG